MRIVVFPGGLRQRNLGDLAMLQVTLRRLRELLPNATIQAVTTDAEELASYCPEAEPLLDPGWSALLGDKVVTVRLRRLSYRAHQALEETLKSKIPGIYEKLFWLKVRRHEANGAGVGPTLEAVSRADALVFSGMGGFCDTFESNAIRMARLIQFASRKKKPVLLFGQGIGPIPRTSYLWSVCREAFQSCQGIACREGLHGPRVLEEMGVERERIEVTGDDALEAVAQHKIRAGTRGIQVGINLRAAAHSGLGREEAEGVGRKIARVMRRSGLEGICIPIARYGGAADSEVVEEAFRKEHVLLEQPEWTVREAIRAAGQALVAVTVSYHAGVFAAAQGVPVIGLTPNLYYRYKFEGLRERFGPGVLWMNPLDDRFEQEFQARLEKLCGWGEAQRREMEERAFAQVCSSRECYRRWTQRLG